MNPGELRLLATRKNELLFLIDNGAAQRPRTDTNRMYFEAALLEGQIAKEYEVRKDFLNAAINLLSQASCFIRAGALHEAKLTLRLLIGLPVNPSAMLVARQLLRKLEDDAA